MGIIFSLVTLAGLIIGTGEGSLIGLSLGLPLGSPLESTNTGADMPGTLLGAPPGLWFEFDVVWGVGISCLPLSGAFITSTMNSVRYLQLVELLTLSLSHTWLIPNSREM